MSETEYLILGAGLAGLSAAYHLEEKNCNDWIILERSKSAGGLCKSLNDNGFIFDHSIHILYSSDDYASKLIKKLLGRNMLIQERESWVYSSGVYTPYPWQANTYGLPVDIVKECLLGVIKATYEKKKGSNSSNFEEWCYETFGEGLARHFMIPYNRKQWAIDPKKMTDAWIRDRVMTPFLDEVIEGALHRQEKSFGPNAVFWYPETGGIESLPNAFLPYLDQERTLYNTEATRVLWKEKIVSAEDGREWHYDRLISSLPLPILAKYLEPELSAELKEASNRLENNVVYAINLAVKRDEISPYHWVYFPEEKYLFHRISFPKNFSKAMVPSGSNSITVEVSASRYKSVPAKNELSKRVISELKGVGVIGDSDAVEVKSILTLNPAYIIYNHGHRENVDALLQFLEENSIFSCGRFGEWEYLNMDHSILSGKSAVDKS